MKNTKKNKGKVFIILLVLMLIFLNIYNMWILYLNIKTTDDKYDSKKVAFSTNTLKTVEKDNAKEEQIEDILEKIEKSVVGISKIKNIGGSILNNISSSDLGLGTGIIVSENGYILSNSHVTGEKFSTCFVTIDETTYKGNVVWADNDLDLAILKIFAHNLQYVELGNSDNLRIGEKVYAIGNPIGYEFRKTVTAGIVSALNRTVKLNEDNENFYFSNLIQTDATINPGNSGGPLINSKGDVIGINTVKITSADGIGFAIPINVIKNVIESYKINNEFNEATLGINVYDTNIAKYLKLEQKTKIGIFVSKININGPAYNTELKEGDLINSIDGNILKNINDLREYLYTKRPGDIVEVKILRNNKEKTINIVLGKK